MLNNQNMTLVRVEAGNVEAGAEGVAVGRCSSLDYVDTPVSVVASARQ